MSEDRRNREAHRAARQQAYEDAALYHQVRGEPHATGSRAAIKAAVLTVWNSPEFDNATDDEGAGMVADAVLALGRTTPDCAATLCYHQHQHVGPDYDGPSVAGYPQQTKRWCKDCGASVTAAYGFALPDLAPMPLEADSDA